MALLFRDASIEHMFYKSQYRGSARSGQGVWGAGFHRSEKVGGSSVAVDELRDQFEQISESFKAKVVEVGFSIKHILRKGVFG